MKYMKAFPTTCVMILPYIWMPHPPWRLPGVFIIFDRTSDENLKFGLTEPWRPSWVGRQMPQDDVEVLELAIS